MPTLYDASKKLRNLPDSIYGASTKLSSISLSRMAVNDQINQQNTDIPSGVVIGADDLERRVKVLLIKIKNIGTYLQQIPMSIKGSQPPVNRRLDFEGAGRRGKMRGGADETDETINELEDYLRDLDNRPNRYQTPNNQERTGIQDSIRTLDTIIQNQRRMGVQDDFAEEVKDDLENYQMNGEGDLDEIMSRYQEVIQNAGSQPNLSLNRRQEQNLSISSRLINFNSLFGKASQSIDDALIFFNENIAPYKNSITTVQIEQINKSIDVVNSIFLNVKNSPVIQSLQSNRQTYEPLDQLISLFADFRVSIRAVINSAKKGYINSPNDVNPANPVGGDSVMMGGGRSGGGCSGGSVHYRQNSPSISVLGKYKNYTAKYLL
jgi:hypothetical protein